MSRIIVSIIILNWNGKKHLERCLKSWRKVTYPFKEIIVVNNGSTDDSKDFIENYYPEVKIVELKKNIGYAGGNNAGVKHAKGEYILILNNDTEVTPDFLEPLLFDFRNDPMLGIIQPQLRSLLDRQLLDSVGSFLTSTGFLYHYGYMKQYKNELYEKPLDVYSIKGACFMMKKKDYVRLGGFDEDFSCYIEETDLCHRVWLNGLKVRYEPRSVVYHLGGGDTHIMTLDKERIYLSFRNRINLFIKNISLKHLIFILPLHLLFCQLFVIISLLRRQFTRALAAERGIIEAFWNIRMTYYKRKKINKSIRKVSDDVLMKTILYNPRASYYKHLSYSLEGFEDETLSK